MMPGETISVLIVDDDPLVLAAVSRLLRKRGMKTACTDSPFGVSALMRKESPDVLVLDCDMPGLNGAHLVRVLRASPRTAATPVVLHSGGDEHTLAELASSLSARYAQKGRGPTALVDAIEAAARGPRARMTSVH